MVKYPNPRRLLSLEELKRRGDRCMASAHETVADAQRMARCMAETRDDTRRLHDRLHGAASSVTLVH